MRRFVSLYGAGPLHLLALLVTFAVAGYTALHLVARTSALIMLAWFVGAIVAHDFVLFPLYALVDRALTKVSKRWSRASMRAHLSPLNYLRVPAMGSALLFLVFFPGIVRQGQRTYVADTGQTQQPFLLRWLLITAAMFAVSALAYGLRRASSREARG